MSSVLIPGSFDPITLGHLDIITRAADRFDRVTVAVMNNDMQKYVQGAAVKQYMFSLTERKAMAEAACAHLPGVEVIAAGGMLVKLFDCVKADFIVKGVRNTADFEYEQKHALYNRSLDARAETLYMPADPAFDGISSTLARRRLVAGESVEGILPEAVIQWILAHPRA
jgi:pantetheine-phosphate adenylyltransferase